MSKWRVYAAVLGALALAFLCGRMTVPRQYVTVDKLVEVEKAAKAQVATAVAAKEAAKKEAIRWRTQTVYLPGGTVTVTKEVIKEVERKASESSATTATVVETHERTKVEVHTKVVTAPLPNWAIGASAGLDTGMRRHFQGDIGRRIIGPVWLTGTVDVTSRAALVGVRFVF